MDAIRCEGKAMKTRFLPDICPNKVAVYFQGAERLDTYLLPIIEGSCECENTLRSWRHCYIPGVLIFLTCSQTSRGYAAKRDPTASRRLCKLA